MFKWKAFINLPAVLNTLVFYSDIFITIVK